MKVTSIENGKMLVEVENNDIKDMQYRVIDYVRQIVTENVIKEITKQMLEDKVFMSGIKDAIKSRVDKLQITDMVCFKEIQEKEGRENQ